MDADGLSPRRATGHSILQDITLHAFGRHAQTEASQISIPSVDIACGTWFNRVDCADGDGQVRHEARSST